MSVTASHGILSWDYVNTRTDTQMYYSEGTTQVYGGREKSEISICDLAKAVAASLTEHAGFVVATEVESFTGPYLYSDYAFSEFDTASYPALHNVLRGFDWKMGVEHTTKLNELSTVPFIGILAAIARVAFACIHIAIHSAQALIFQEKGHLYHAAKGVCEIYRGLVDAIPVIGRIYSMCKYSHTGPEYSTHWTIMKIYNPSKPDLVDELNGLWRIPNTAPIRA